MKLFIVLTMIVFSNKCIGCERDFLKIIVKNDTIILNARDISQIDKSNHLITLSESGVEKIKSIKKEILSIHLFDSEDKWIDIDLIEVRQAKRNDKPCVMIQNNEILFYSKNQIVIQGKEWFELSSKIKL